MFNIKERLLIVLARRFFLVFVFYVYPKFEFKLHHLKIISVLQAVFFGKVRFVQFAAPPRHGKSLLCSELYPAWWLGKNPDKQIIHASYAASLSNSFSMKVRAMVRDDVRYRKVFPHMALSPERQRVDDWKTIQGGGFKSIGVTGGITGHGADLFIIDDPHKEGDEQSPAAMQAVFDWWTSAARTRLHPGAAVIFIMTRWAVRDMAGRLIELAEFDPLADQWLVIRFPALAEENDPLGRAVGEALWPERFSRENLLAIRSISERYFNALFQQNPKVDNEPLFELKDFKMGIFGRHFPVHQKPDFWTVDLSSTETERSDYVVFTHWRYVQARLYVLGGERFRAQWPEVKRRLSKCIRANPGKKFYFPPHTLELLALQNLREEMPDEKWRFVEVPQPGDKVQRAGVLSDFAKGGNVYVNRCDFGRLFVREHCGFPDEVDHDDMVDTSSVATHAVGLQSRFSLTVVEVGRAKK